MATWQERSATLAAAINSAEEQVSGLAMAATRAEEAADGVRRLQAALDAARAKVEVANDLGVSQTMLNDLTSTIGQLEATIAQQRQNVVNGGVFEWSVLTPDAVLDALARWPEALPRGAAAAIRREVEGLPTLAASLISELEGRQRGLLNEWARAFASVQGDAAEWSSSLSGDVERLKGEVATQETTLTEQLSRIEAALRDYGEQFTNSEAGRSSEHADAMKATAAKLEESLRASEGETATVFNAIEEMRDKAATLLGAIGHDGMSVGYQNYADGETKSANFWRVVAVTLGIASVLVLGLMVYLITRIHNPTAGDYTGRYGLAVLLGGVAAYAARQSADHRKRANDASDNWLALASLGVYLEPLPDLMQHELLAALASRFFARPESVAPSKPSDDAGPALPSLIQQILGRGHG
jgi:hypothetical protein